MLRQKRDDSDFRKNRLIATLEPGDYAALIREANVVTLKLGKRLYRQGDHIDAVYFPLTCMVSLLLAIKGEAPMEVAMVGREGVVGSPEVIHALRAIGSRVVQLPGRAVQIGAEAFQEVLISRPRILALVHQHLFAELQQALLVSACNRLHRMEERCARWMLMTSDRAGADNFPITQEFLSRMLGVRRAAVNVATGKLKKSGFIHYVRGSVKIIDRRGLESASCNCYQAINSAYDSILPALTKASGNS